MLLSRRLERLEIQQEELELRELAQEIARDSGNEIQAVLDNVRRIKRRIDHLMAGGLTIRASLRVLAGEIDVSYEELLAEYVRLLSEKGVDDGES